MTLRFSAAIAFVCLMVMSESDAQVVSFSDFESLANSVAPDLNLNVIDFDSASPGIVIDNNSVFEGVTFNYDFCGTLMTIETGSTTNSMPNYLGTDDAGLLQDGDELCIEFAPVNAIGLHIVSKDELVDGDVTLMFAGVAASLSGLTIEKFLADGSNVYFIGVYDPTEVHDTASIKSAGGGFFLFNIDDLVMSKTNVLLGDVNLDGVVNLLDIALFVDRLNTGTFQIEADTNQDGNVNLLDVESFIDLISG